VDPKLLAQVVREGAGKFFLRNGVPLATTGVRVIEPGCVWASALDERTVRAVETGCGSVGVRVDRFVPAVAVLGRGLADADVLWPDGGAVAAVQLSGGEMQSVRRLSAAQAPDGHPPTAIAALARLGEDAWRFADAYGAALLPEYETMVFRGSGSVAGEGPGWRMALAGGALAAAIASAAVAPALRATHAEDLALRRMALLQDRRRAASETEHDLARVTAAMSQVAAFDAARYSPTLLLADLTAALPAGSAIVTLRADTVGGSLVALAPRAVAVLRPLEKVPGILTPEIVGPVTREALAGQELERVTVRFGIDAVLRASARAAEGEQ
jgi:hypothetical protein